MNQSLEKFKKSIGNKFRLAGFTGRLRSQDTIIAVDENTKTVEGNFFIAHYTDCRLIEEQPAHLKKFMTCGFF